MTAKRIMRNAMGILVLSAATLAANASARKPIYTRRWPGR
jgi:hypothetical protein